MDDLGKLHQHIETRISDLVNNKFPEYRSVLVRIKPYLKTFQSDPDEDDILVTLNEAQLREDLETRDEAKNILDSKKSATDDESYTAQVEQYMNRVGDSAKARLSQYVIHRKSILQLFRRRLDIGPNDKYEREERIHQVIFPTKTTSDDTPWPLYNLWIIDERLSFHHV
jgi:hypothetical protein